MELYDLKQEEERFILVGIQLGDNELAEESLDKLEELARTAGAAAAGRLIQNREAMHPQT